MRSILIALQVAERMRWTDVIIVNDMMEFIKTLKWGDDRLLLAWRVLPWVEDCRHLSSHFPKCIFNIVPKVANWAAHDLGRESRIFDCCLSRVGSLGPSCISSIIEAELSY